MKKNSRGIFKQETNGKWMIDTTLTINGEYKHFRRRGYDTLASARADYEMQKALFIKEHNKSCATMLFDDLMEEYEEMRSHKVNQTTLVCDRSNFNKHILPYFSNKLIKDVFTKDSINYWYGEIRNNDLSENKQVKVIGTMKDLLLFTYNNRYIDAETYQLCDTQLIKVKVSKTSRKERDIWNDEEEKLFLKATEENAKDNLMFRVLLYSGMRISEFLALQVKCYDRQKKRLLVVQQVVNLTGKGAVTTNVLKSKESNRAIPLNDKLSKDIENYIDTLGLSTNDYLWFGKAFNQAMGKSTFRRKLEYYTNKAGVKKIVPHGIRHEVAVKLARVCENTEDIEVSASILGHTASIFLDIYANHKDDNKKANMLNKVFGA